jgi:hypothetical protein
MVHSYSIVSEKNKREAIKSMAYSVSVDERPAEITKRMETPVRYTKDSVSA